MQKLSAEAKANKNKYIADYNKNKYKKYVVLFNKGLDQDIIEFLSTKPSAVSYIKGLIREAANRARKPAGKLGR